MAAEGVMMQYRTPGHERLFFKATPETVGHFMTGCQRSACPECLIAKEKLVDMVRDLRDRPAAGRA